MLAMEQSSEYQPPQGNRYDDAKRFQAKGIYNGRNILQPSWLGFLRLRSTIDTTTFSAVFNLALEDGYCNTTALWIG